MAVSKLELFVDHSNDRGVIQVHQTDAQSRPVDPFSFVVQSEFIMAFANLISREQLDTIETLTNLNATLENDKTLLENQVAQLTATITQLQSENLALKPWNNRWIDPQKFVARFTGPQAQKVYTSIDPVLVGGRELLNTYIADNYQVVLDDEQVTSLTSLSRQVLQVQSLTGYMVMVGILTAEERANILRDSSSDERYQPTAP